MRFSIYIDLMYSTACYFFKVKTLLFFGPFSSTFVSFDDEKFFASSAIRPIVTHSFETRSYSPLRISVTVLLFTASRQNAPVLSEAVFCIYLLQTFLSSEKMFLALNAHSHQWRTLTEVFADGFCSHACNVILSYRDNYFLFTAYF